MDNKQQPRGDKNIAGNSPPLTNDNNISSNPQIKPNVTPENPINETLQTNNQQQNIATQQTPTPTVFGPQVSGLNNTSSTNSTTDSFATPQSVNGSPSSSQPTVSSPPTPSKPPQMSGNNKFKGSKLLIPMVVIALIIIGGVAAAYNAIVINSPEGIWKNAMTNTSRGFDELVKIASEEPSKGGVVEGSFKVSSPVVVDGSINGKWYETESQYNIDVGFSGFRPKLELRSITPSVSTTPDLYIKLEEIGSLQALLGANNPMLNQLINEVDGNWFVVDHTLFEQALSAGGSQENESLDFSQEEIQEIGEKVSSVLKERLFTVDQSKAVIVVDEPIGKEDFEGESSYKYSIKAQKQQTKDLVTALVESFKGTKVEELLISEQSNQSIEDYLDTEELLKNIEEMDFSNATAEAWVSLDTKLIRNVRITPDNFNGESGYLDIGMPYKGGDEIPLKINIVYDNSESSDKGDIAFELKFNKSNKSVIAEINTETTSGEEIFVAEASIIFTPSNEEINVEVPANARNVYELLRYLYGGYGSQPELEALPGGTLGDNTDLLNIPFLDSIQL